MIQNIKVDIVYYMTATDFEFEFNLGSCCHMRLLNDKAKDKKGYVNSLARAVSRSQIILSVGPVFGEDGLISVTSSAIGKGLKTIDNKAFGITDDSKIEIIDGAVPLVTPEGYFGGCIIESGPQTIIILTENRTIRKSIMKTLIHPYIEDMSLLQSAGTSSLKRADSPVPPVTPAFEPETPDMVLDDPEEADEAREPETPTDGTDELYLAEEEPEYAAEETAEEHDGECQNEGNEIEFDLSDNTDNENGEEYQSEDISGGEVYFSEDIEQEKKKGLKGINISIILITMFLLLAVLALCYFLIFLPLANGVSTTEYIGQLFGGVSSTTSV